MLLDDVVVSSTSKDETITLPCNIRNQLRSDVASRPRTAETSEARSICDKATVTAAVLGQKIKDMLCIH